MKRVMSALVLFALLFSGCDNKVPTQEEESAVSQDASTQEKKPDVLHFRWGDTFEEVRDAVKTEYGVDLQLITPTFTHHNLSLESLQGVMPDLSDVDWNPPGGAFPLGVPLGEPYPPPEVTVVYKFKQEPSRLNRVGMSVGNLPQEVIERFVNIASQKYGKPKNTDDDFYVWKTERSHIHLSVYYYWIWPRREIMWIYEDRNESP